MIFRFGYREFPFGGFEVLDRGDVIVYRLHHIVAEATSAYLLVYVLHSLDKRFHILRRKVFIGIYQRLKFCPQTLQCACGGIVKILENLDIVLALGKLLEVQFRQILRLFFTRESK